MRTKNVLHIYSVQFQEISFTLLTICKRTEDRPNPYWCQSRDHRCSSLRPGRKLTYFGIKIQQNNSVQVPRYNYVLAKSVKCRLIIIIYKVEIIIPDPDTYLASEFNFWKSNIYFKLTTQNLVIQSVLYNKSTCNT